MFQVSGGSPRSFGIRSAVQLGGGFGEYVHCDRHGTQPAHSRERPSIGPSIVVGEPVGDEQTDADAQRDSGASDQDQLPDCQDLFIKDTPRI